MIDLLGWLLLGLSLALCAVIAGAQLYVLAKGVVLFARDRLEHANARKCPSCTTGPIYVRYDEETATDSLICRRCGWHGQIVGERVR